MEKAIHKAIFGFYPQPIKKQKLVNLKNYKYNGVDLSLLSKYVLGPYWNWLVTLFPLWVAPNMITLMGFLLVVTAFGAILWQSLVVQAELTLPIYVYTAFCLFAYQSLDAIDGKQARRTGMSGPLGQLFDHGCDAVSLVLEGIMMPIIFMIRSPSIGFGLLCSAMVAFYAATWDEYHTGTLLLSYVSGPVEGQIVLVGLCLLGAVYGKALWMSPITTINGYSFNFGEIVGLLTIFSAMIAAVGNIINVAAGHKEKKGRGGKGDGGVVKALARLLPFGSFILNNIIIFWLTPELHTNARSMTLFASMCGIGSSTSIFLIMIAHLSKDDFPGWNPTFIPTIVILLKTIGSSYGVKLFQNVSLQTLLIIGLGYNLIVYGRLVVATINQICRYLKINCLTVQSKRLAN